MEILTGSPHGRCAIKLRSAGDFYVSQSTENDMAEISRNLLAYKAVMPRWFVALLVAGGLLAGSSLYFFRVESPQMVMAPSASIPSEQKGRGPASVEPSEPSPPVSKFSAGGIANKPAIFFGIAFCSVAAAISVFVLLISLPVFLFSSNAERVARAGGLVKTTLGFFVGSAGTIIATISFAPI